MKRIVTFVLGLALASIQSCSESTAPATGTLGVTLRYGLSGGLAAYRAEMTITSVGVVWASVVHHNTPDELEEAPPLQLSRVDIARLRRMLEPFAGFESHYSDPSGIVDAPSLNIAVERGGAKHAVGIYPAGYASIPADLIALRAWLQDLFERAMERESGGR